MKHKRDKKNYIKRLLAKQLPKLYGIYFNIAVHFNPQKIARKAFLLFCTPRKGGILPEHKLFLNNAKHDLINSGTIRLQTYLWPGDGATVLVMHGWESNTNRWRDLIVALQKEKYNIVAFDAPAHGYSSGKVLNLPLYADCAQKVIEIYLPKYSIGHSFGGMTMVYNQYKYHNACIEKMISLGAPSELSDFMRQYQKIIGLNKNMMKHLEAYFVTMFNFKFADFSSPKFARTLTLPGLLIHDEFDTIAPIWSSEEVHAVWKNSILIKTKGLGHSLHQDKVRSQIIDFLKS